MNEMDDLILLFEELDNYSDKGIKLTLNFNNKHTGEIEKQDLITYNVDAIVCQLRHAINDSIKYRTLVQTFADFTKGMRNDY